MVRVLEESAVATSATDTCQGTSLFLAARRCGIARPVWGTPLSPQPSLSEALLPCLIRLGPFLGQGCGNVPLERRNKAQHALTPTTAMLDEAWKHEFMHAVRG